MIYQIPLVPLSFVKDILIVNEPWRPQLNAIDGSALFQPCFQRPGRAWWSTPPENSWISWATWRFDPQNEMLEMELAYVGLIADL